MALDYKIIESEKLVYVTGTGVITYQELINHIDALSRESNYKAPMKKLVDYRKITSVNLSSQESELFASKKAAHSNIFSGEKCALVVSVDIVFGIARVHDILISFKEPNIETMAFRDFNEAKKWLGLELDEKLIHG